MHRKLGVEPQTWDCRTCVQILKRSVDVGGDGVVLQKADLLDEPAGRIFDVVPLQTADHGLLGSCLDRFA